MTALLPGMLVPDLESWKQEFEKASAAHAQASRKTEPSTQRVDVRRQAERNLGLLPHAGVITVRLVAARNAIGTCAASTHPYVVGSLSDGRMAQHSRVIEGSNSPEWDTEADVLVFDLDYINSQTLSPFSGDIRVHLLSFSFYANMGESDEPLGHARISLLDAFNHGTAESSVPVWTKLVDSEVCSGAELCLRFHYAARRSDDVGDVESDSCSSDVSQVTDDAGGAFGTITEEFTDIEVPSCSPVAVAESAIPATDRKTVRETGLPAGQDTKAADADTGGTAGEMADELLFSAEEDVAPSTAAGSTSACGNNQVQAVSSSSPPEQRRESVHGLDLLESFAQSDEEEDENKVHDLVSLLPTPSGTPSELDKDGFSCGARDERAVRTRLFSDLDAGHEHSPVAQRLSPAKAGAAATVLAAKAAALAVAEFLESSPGGTRRESSRREQPAASQKLSRVLQAPTSPMPNINPHGQRRGFVAGWPLLLALLVTVLMLLRSLMHVSSASLHEPQHQSPELVGLPGLHRFPGQRCTREAFGVNATDSGYKFEGRSTHSLRLAPVVHVIAPTGIALRSATVRIIAGYARGSDTLLLSSAADTQDNSGHKPGSLHTAWNVATGTLELTVVDDAGDGDLSTRVPNAAAAHRTEATLRAALRQIVLRSVTCCHDPTSTSTGSASEEDPLPAGVGTSRPTCAAAAPRTVQITLKDVAGHTSASSELSTIELVPLQTPNMADSGARDRFGTAVEGPHVYGVDGSVRYWLGTAETRAKSGRKVKGGATGADPVPDDDGGALCLPIAPLGLRISAPGEKLSGAEVRLLGTDTTIPPGELSSLLLLPPDGFRSSRSPDAIGRIHARWDPEHAVLHLEGRTSVAAYEEALQGVCYRGTSALDHRDAAAPEVLSAWFLVHGDSGRVAAAAAAMAAGAARDIVLLGAQQGGYAQPLTRGRREELSNVERGRASTVGAMKRAAHELNVAAAQLQSARTRLRIMQRTTESRSDTAMQARMHQFGWAIVVLLALVRAHQFKTKLGRLRFRVGEWRA